MASRVCGVAVDRWTLWMALVLLLRHSTGSYPSRTTDSEFSRPTGQSEVSTAQIPLVSPLLTVSPARTVRAIHPGDARNLASPTAHVHKPQLPRLADRRPSIQPTRTTAEPPPEVSGGPLTTTTTTLPGEAAGGPQGRSLPLPPLLEGPASTGPAPHPTTTTLSVTPTLSPNYRSDEPRRTAPDIQDIITGIVKLLNGNVKVQANPHPPLPGPRPATRPLHTRINNRGPPRITDLPPDFATRLPHPYPFDLPPPAGGLPLPPQPQPQPSDRPYVTGVPLPEQVVPVASPHRPHRPRPPLWPPPELAVELRPPSSDQVSLYEDEAGLAQPEEDEGTTSSSSATTATTSQTTTTTTTTVATTGTTTTSATTTSTSTKTVKPTTKPSAKPTTARPTAAKPTTARPTTARPTAAKPTTKSTSPSTTSEASTLDEQPSPQTAKPAVPDATTPVAPVLPEPSTGVGSAVPVLESSMLEILLLEATAGTENLAPSSSATFTPPITVPSSQVSHFAATGSTGFSYHPYKPRPGIVLDDTEYKPGNALQRPIITAAAGSYPGEAFDVTVSAVQGPGAGAGTVGQPFVYPVEMEGVSLPGADGGNVSVITTPKDGEHFVSIDGKRTYFNLLSSTTGVTPSRATPAGARPLPSSAIGTGYAVPQPVAPFSSPAHKQSGVAGGPPVRRRPTHPPVRIDTCIVGDDSTCDSAQNEMCRTEAGVSSCHCRPSYSRRKHREPCRRVSSILMSLRVDKLYERKLVWSDKLLEHDSEQYQQLAWEAARAIDSAMSMTPFSDDFLGAHVNSMYTSSTRRGSVFVNVTLQLEESGETLRPAVRLDIQRHLLGVIHRRNNNIGDSALWVDSPPGSVSHLQDMDECSRDDLHDCHVHATCTNVFGSFRCECADGYRDPWAEDPRRSGRQCAACSPDFCSGRGECRYQDGRQVCQCTGNFYGAQCEVDGEVLGVAVGASVAAVVIILLTVVCLCMWSRRWSREQKTAAGMGSPVFGYMGTAGSSVKTPGVGAPPYQVSMEDRLRWVQIADVMAQANHYAPEPVNMPTRPSSAVFGYPSLSMSGTLPHLGPPPVPLPRLGLSHGVPTICSQRARTPDRTVESTSSEEEDRADLLGRNFHVPRPKSRSSIANQSGIYYDVDYDQSVYGTTTKSHHTAIPLSTYSRPPYYRP